MEGCSTLYKPAPLIVADAVRFGHVAFPTGISTGACIYISRQYFHKVEIAG